MSTIVKPKIVLDEELKRDVQSLKEEKSQVIINCSYTGRFGLDRIRIWKSTYLFPAESSDRIKLLYAENITFYPIWMSVPTGKTIKFVLVFSGLPKGCKYFDLVEDIPEPGGFIRNNIQRNKSDVYHIDMTS